MPGLDYFLWGIAGAAIDEVLHWASLRRRKEFPSYWLSWRYWFITAALVLVGGVVAFAVCT